MVKTRPRSPRSCCCAAAVLVVATGCAGAPEVQWTGPEYGETFWQHWGDGRAELAVYDLVYPRYGVERRGSAVAIFVTETFSNSLRVKDERPGRPESDEFPVIKLNLVQDFRTGIYDYNLMTSAFVALEPVNGRPAGSPTKISFSSQEWCGQVWSQALIDEDRVRWTSHSYFDGEADAQDRLAFPAAGITEDGLLLWAHGLAGPTLDPGGSVELPLLRSLERVRLRHVEPAVDRVRLSRAAAPERVQVPGGDFEVERFTAEIADAAGPREWSFLVERAAPHRVVTWRRSDGQSGELRGTRRLAYWELNGPEHDRALSDLGL